MVKTVRKGKKKHWDKKNLSRDCQRHKITIKCSQAQKNLTAHNTFRNPSLHSQGWYHSVLDVPDAASDGSSIKQTCVTRRKEIRGKKRKF